MIVTSKIDSKKYFWVKVPRTATHSYEKIFFPQFNDGKIGLNHLHASYFELQTATCENKPKVEGGFSVVRHPYTRFVSALKFLKMKHNVTNHFEDKEKIISICEFCEETTVYNDFYLVNHLLTSYVNFFETETTFYDFIYSHFDKNCMLKTGYHWSGVFKVELPTLITTMFNTQTFFAYHPQVRIFKYENLQEFNMWINDTLGISTSSLSKNNSSSDVQLNIDVTTKKFKDLVKYLFHDDFKLFGYDL
jgi:hypothetical protein